ncbi:MAG TPA: SRPBCC family protein [Polyangia bacterium]|nr:SRPBCC family protein [Polyangia bacterium]
MDSREPVRRRHHVPRATPREVYDVVVDFPAYPRLFPELKEARVLSRTGDVARVEFRAHMVMPIRYVLDLTCASSAAPLTVDWKFVEGEIVTNNVGGWRFSPEGDGTAVDYTVSLDVKAPVPGFVLRKIIDGLVSASLPNMFVSLEREVRRRQAAGAAAAPPSSTT